MLGIVDYWVWITVRTKIISVCCIQWRSAVSLQTNASDSQIYTWVLHTSVRKPCEWWAIYTRVLIWEWENSQILIIPRGRTREYSQPLALELASTCRFYRWTRKCLQLKRTRNHFYIQYAATKINHEWYRTRTCWIIAASKMLWLEVSRRRCVSESLYNICIAIAV